MYAKLLKALATGLVVLSMSAIAVANDDTMKPEINKLPQVWKVVDGKWTFINQKQKPQTKHQVFFKPFNLKIAENQVKAKLEKMPFITVELQASED